MLYEFALTPDVFDADMIEADPVHEVILVQFLRGMCDNGMIANLHRDKWIKHLQEERIPYLSPSLIDKILVCLTTLNDRHRLVRHPQRVAGDPPSDRVWLELALESHRRIAFHGIIVSQNLLDSIEDNNDDLIELSKVLDAPQWQNRRRSLSLTKSEADYRLALAPLLRYAKSLDIIDPYLSCRESRFLDTVKLCIALMGQRGYAVLPGRIHIHAGNPEKDKKNDEPIKTRLDAWEQKLRPLISSQTPHRFKVFLWDSRLVGETFHDRYILTDQCGISIPAGLDYVTSSTPNSTTWSLIDEEDRRRRLEDFDPSTSPFKLLGEREVQ